MIVALALACAGPEADGAQPQDAYRGCSGHVSFAWDPPNENTYTPDYEEDLDYDALGWLVRDALGSSSDYGDLTTDWVVRDDGQAEVTTWDLGNDGYVDFELDSGYGDDDLVDTQDEFHWEQPIAHVEYTNEDGKVRSVVLEETNYATGLVLAERDEYAYDGLGRWIRTDIYYADADPVPARVGTRQYLGPSNLATGYQERLVGSGWPVVSEAYEYDARSRVTRVFQRDETVRVATDDAYEYDDDDDLVDAAVLTSIDVLTDEVFLTDEVVYTLEDDRPVELRVHETLGDVESDAVGVVEWTCGSR
jgi:hypothetical protein